MALKPFLFPKSRALCWGSASDSASESGGGIGSDAVSGGYDSYGGGGDSWTSYDSSFSTGDAGGGYNSSDFSGSFNGSTSDGYSSGFDSSTFSNDSGGGSTSFFNDSAFSDPGSFFDSSSTSSFNDSAFNDPGSFFDNGGSTSFFNDSAFSDPGSFFSGVNFTDGSQQFGNFFNGDNGASFYPADSGGWNNFVSPSDSYLGAGNAGFPGETLSGFDIAGDLGRSAADNGNSLAGVTGGMPSTSLGYGQPQGQANTADAVLGLIGGPAAIAGRAGADLTAAMMYSGLGHLVAGTTLAGRDAQMPDLARSQTLPEVEIVSARDLPVNTPNPLAQAQPQSNFGAQQQPTFGPASVAQAAPPAMEAVQAPSNAQVAQAAPPPTQAMQAPTSAQVANPYTSQPSMALPAVEASKVGELVGTPGQVTPTAGRAPGEDITWPGPPITAAPDPRGSPEWAPTNSQPPLPPEFTQPAPPAPPPAFAPNTDGPFAPASPGAPPGDRTADAAKSLLDMTPAQMNAALLEAARPGSVQPPSFMDRVADFFSPAKAEAADPLKAIIDAIRTGPFAAIPGNQSAQQAKQQAADQQWFNRGATPTDKYLADVYNRTPQKVDSTGDFTWKDAAAANHYGKGTTEYAIGGMDPDFRTVLEAAGRAMDRAGIPWSMSAGYRDNARQGITEGFRASTTGSLHGGTGRLGGERNDPMSTYGRGRAVDLTGVEPGARKSDNGAVWNFIDKHGAKFGLNRPMAGKDPPHVQPTANFRQIAQAIRSGLDPMVATPAQVAQAGRGPGASRDGRSSFGPFTAYAPGTGGKMEGGENAKWNGPDGSKRAHTAEDVRAARARGENDYVTLAKHDRSPYKVGQEINIPTLTYQDRNGNWQTLHDVKGVVHDRGTAKAMRGGALDVATFSGKGLTDKQAKPLLAGGIKTDGQQVAAMPQAPAVPTPNARPQAVPHIPGVTAPAVMPPPPAQPPPPPTATGSPGGLPGQLPPPPTQTAFGEGGSPAGLPGQMPSAPQDGGSPGGLPGQMPGPPGGGGSPPGLPGAYMPGPPGATGSPAGQPGLLDFAQPDGGSPPGLPGAPPTMPPGPDGGSAPGLPGSLPTAAPGRDGGSPTGLPGDLPIDFEGGSPPGLPGPLPTAPPGREGGSPGGLPGNMPVAQDGGLPAGLPGQLPSQRAYNPADGATGSPGGLPGDYTGYQGFNPADGATGSPAGLPGQVGDYPQEGVPTSAMPTAPANPRSEPLYAPLEQFGKNAENIKSKFTLTEDQKKSGKDFLSGLTDKDKADIVSGRVPMSAIIEREALKQVARGDHGRAASMMPTSVILPYVRDAIEKSYPGGIAALNRDATAREMAQFGGAPGGLPGSEQEYAGMMPTAPAAPPSALPAMPGWMQAPSSGTTQPASLAQLYGQPADMMPVAPSAPPPGDAGGLPGGRAGLNDMGLPPDYGVPTAPVALDPVNVEAQAPTAFAPPAVQEAQQAAQSNPQQAQQIAQANPQAVQQIAQQLGVDILTAAMILAMEERPRQFIPRGDDGTGFGRWPQMPMPDFPGQYAGVGREMVRQNYEAQNPINSLVALAQSQQFNPASWDAVMAHAPYSQNIEDRRGQMMMGMR